MANFKEAYKLTSILEGGYVNDPHDRGGETYKGIARKHHPTWEGWTVIDKLKTKEEIPNSNNKELLPMVKSFYKTEFWDKIKGSEYKSQLIANELYDTAVNMGVHTAAKLLQKAINLLLVIGKTKLHVDGIIGAKTIRNANNMKNNVLLKTLNGYQFSRYVEICENNPTQRRFFKGWLRRIAF